MTQTSSTLHFPEGFLWGTASAAHQVEGDNTNNQWWAFEQKSGAIWHGDRSEKACAWWNNPDSDFDRMVDLGLNAHRLSVEWSRIEPRPGEFDHRALDRYRAILDGLHRRGIQPMVTLHHFTEPLWFSRIGGWENGASVAFFRRYVETTVQALSDLCDTWVTINEPLILVTRGWFIGDWPPENPNFVVALKVIRNLLNAHAEAYHAIHAVQANAKVGYAKHVRLFKGMRPESKLDRYAAGIKRWLFEHVWVAGTKDGLVRPPVGTLQRNSRLANTYDFMGFNYYTRDFVRFSPNPTVLFGNESFPADGERSDEGRDGPFSNFDPEGLAQVCREFTRFDPTVPIYITENGVPDREDRFRARWLVAHLAHLHRAIQDGCNVRGYFHWTLVDNFEWVEGWGLRFGLYALDPQTQVRTARPSAQVYSEIAHNNAISSATVERLLGQIE